MKYRFNWANSSYAIELLSSLQWQQPFNFFQNGVKLGSKSGDDMVFILIVFVIGVSRKVQAYVMAGIIVAKLKPAISIHIVIGVHQANSHTFDVDEFREMKNRAVNKFDFTADKAGVGTALVVGGMMRPYNLRPFND